jgi:hypothetical protein
LAPTRATREGAGAEKSEGPGRNPEPSWRSCRRQRRAIQAYRRSRRRCPSSGSPRRGVGAVTERWRRFCCAVCQREAVVCPECERGQRYCRRGCARARRREAVRRASAAAQRTHRGATLHALRQRRYRSRQLAKFLAQKVTQQSVTQGPASAIEGESVPVVIGKRKEARNDVAMARNVEGSRGTGPILCSFCSRPMPRGAQLDRLRRAIRDRERAAPRRHRSARPPRGPPVP